MSMQRRRVTDRFALPRHGSVVIGTTGPTQQFAGNSVVAMRHGYTPERQMLINRQLLAPLASALLAAVTAATPASGDARNAHVVAVDDFRARVIDGDWAPAVRAAIAATNVRDTVGFSRNRRYSFKSVVVIDKPSIKLDGRDALIEQSALDATTGDIGLFTVTANDVRFTHLRLQATAAPKPVGPVEFLIQATNGGGRMRIDHCYFGAMPFSTSAAQAAVGFRVGADGGSVTFSKFETGVGGVFTQGRATVIADNVFRHPGDMSIAFNGTGASDGIASRNEIHAEGLTISASIGVEEGASNFHISYNQVYGGHGPAIWCVHVAVKAMSHGGLIDHNWIDGGSQTASSPSALLAITDKCSDVAISDNYFLNSPIGDSGNAVIIIPTNGIRFFGNRILPGPKAVGYGVLIYPSGGTLTLISNSYKTSAPIPTINVIENGKIYHLIQYNNHWTPAIDLKYLSIP